MELSSNYIYKCSFDPELYLVRPKTVTSIVVICEYADLDDFIVSYLLKDEVGFLKMVHEDRNVRRQVSRRDVVIVELGPAYVKSGTGVVCKG